MSDCTTELRVMLDGPDLWATPGALKINASCSCGLSVTDLLPASAWLRDDDAAGRWAEEFRRFHQAVHPSPEDHAVSEPKATPPPIRCVVSGGQVYFDADSLITWAAAASTPAAAELVTKLTEAVERARKMPERPPAEQV